MVVKNCIRIAIMVILLASMLPSSIIMVKGDNTIYVDDDGDGDFTTIQAAINAANNGDTIYIKNGIYNGGISINKIVYIVGESKNAIVDCGNNYGFQIWSSGTEINGITIKNAGEGYAGIIVYAEATIKNCNFSYNYEAIHVVGSENGLIMRNVFYNNYYGITFVNSYFNVIRENYFIKNQKAISLGTDTSDNIFCYNNFMSNIVDVDDESGLNFWDYEYVGNYWDRYNGIDSDGDGIGDTPYKIDEAKGIMDHYPLMQNYTGIDIFPPDIMNLCANPVIQEPNGNVNITCKIVDNVGVNVAFVNITFPNGSYINKSLNQIGNSSYYYFNRSYSLKGIYYYHVWANDTNNNSVKTKLHKFVIAYAPHVSFNYTPTQPTDLDTVNFISNSRDSDGVIVNYTWSIYDPILKKTIARFYTSNFSYTFPDNGNYEVTLTVTDNDGAWNTTTKEINVANIPPVANFTWQLLPPFYPTQPYVGQHIKFYSQSYDVDGEIRVYKWYFGDGNSVITGENYTIYSYSVNGVFNITLVVTDNDYGEATITKSIAVYDIFPPSIKNLTAYPNPQEAGNYINISCKIYEDVGVKYAWLIIQYPNGSILNVTMNALGNTYFYNFHCEEPGNYSYYVDTSDINGNKNSSSLNYFNVIVPPSPPSITNVSVTPNWQVEYGEDANITCHVVDNVGVASVVIDLNGNKSMNGITDGIGNGIYYYILHFPSIGNYSFKIYATDINGYVNSTHYFNFTVADTMAPSVEGLSYKTYMVPGWQNISCNISDPSGVYEARINITYPDGSYVNESMQKSGTYYYNIFCNATGKYYFYIWTQDAIGNAGKSMLYNFSVTTPPVANFTWQPLKPYSHELITFNANSSYDEDGYIVLYKWDWDNDGIYDISTTSPVITYSWNKSGTYAVTLTVVDNAYAETNITKYISIRNIPPIANFSWQPLYPVANESVIFNANSSYDVDGDIVNYTWQFGDGSTGYGMIVNHSYTAYGEYNVTLVVTDDDGNSSTISKRVEVIASTPEILIISPLNGSIVYGIVSIKGNASSNNGIVKVEIKIDNGSWMNATGTLSWQYEWNTSHVNNGIHVIEARCYNGFSYGYDSIVVNVENIDFYYTPSNPVSSQPVYFFASPSKNYTWQFGDGSIAYGSNVSHVYPIGNYYNVTMQLKINNDTISITKSIRVDTLITLVKNNNNVVNFISWSASYPIKASELASLIGNPMQKGSVVSKWNTSKGSYDDYIVGISPSQYDFIIHPGDAIVLRVSSSGSFVIPASHIRNRSVTLVKNSNNVVNFISWTSLSSIKASELASLIGNPMQKGSVISKWNTSKGSYDDYIVGISPSQYDFIIHPGDAIVLRVSSSGSFVIPEVIK